MNAYKPTDFGLRVSRTYSTYAACFCPFHNDVHASAAFYYQSGDLFCWVCKRRFTLVHLSDHFGIDPNELEIGASVRLAPQIVPFLEEPVLRLERIGITELSRSFTVSNYVKNVRHISDDALEAYPVSCHITNESVAFVHYDDIGPSGYVLREPFEGGVRYYKHGRLEPLWPLHHLIRQGPQIVLVSEGPFKAMRLFDALRKVDEGREAVALSSFGSLPSGELQTLVNSMWSKTFVMCCDNDEPGIKFGKWFKSFQNCLAVVVPTPFDNGADEENVVNADKILHYAKEHNRVRSFKS